MEGERENIKTKGGSACPNQGGHAANWREWIIQFCIGTSEKGKDQRGLGRPKRLFKEEVGGEWVIGKITNAWSDDKSLPAFLEKKKIPLRVKLERL